MSPTMREVTLVDPFWEREDFSKYLNISSLISFAIHFSGFGSPDYLGFRTGTEILLRCLETLFSVRKKYLESLHLSCVHAGSFSRFHCVEGTLYYTQRLNWTPTGVGAMELSLWLVTGISS
jgi:hypothetical protein